MVLFQQVPVVSPSHFYGSLPLFLPSSSHSLLVFVFIISYFLYIGKSSNNYSKDDDGARQVRAPGEGGEPNEGGRRQERRVPFLLLSLSSNVFIKSIKILIFIINSGD